MASFFSALNPVSSRSGITFAATGRSYSAALNQQELPDLTLDLIIPFLWSQNLSVIDGIYETFTVFYGDHFDKHGVGVGRKGVLDFTIAPLAVRKLIADTYLDSRKNTYVCNTLAWVIAMPVKLIDFTIALACTIALIPLIILVTFLRATRNYFFPGVSGGGTPGNGSGGAGFEDAYDDNPPPPPPPGGIIELPVHTATAALFQITHYLDNAGLRTPENIRRLFANRHNLALVYAMEQMVGAENGVLLLNQETFDLLMDNWAIFANHQTIDNLA